jgi:hypothetical protein
MNRKTKRSGVRVMGWVVSSISLVLVLSAGALELFAQQGLQRDDMTTVLLTVYVASWLYVFGIAGLALLSVGWIALWLAGWLRMRVKQPAESRYFPAGPRLRPREKPEAERPQFLQDSAAPLVGNRSSRESDDLNNVTSSTRVA